MTAHKPSHLVPKLRFPEFRDGPRWGLLTLSSASDVNPSNDGLPESFIYIDLESVKSSILIERKEITRDTAPSRAQRLLSRKDVIYQTVRPYQRNNFFFDIDDGYEYVASTGYAQLRAHECPEFLYQLIHTDSFVNSVLARCTGSNYPAINPSSLASIPVTLPRKPEQQKIADCLGSLDDLIAEEGRKLEALRQHKQGLMQQLFPQPGETVPRLRFPQFQNAPKWSFESIDEFAQTTTGKRDTQDKVDGGSYPFFVRSQSSERIDTYAYNGEAVLTSGDGVGVGKNFHYIDGKFDFHQRVYCIHQFKSHVLGRFFFFYFSERFGPRVRRMSAKNSVDSVRRSMITDMPVPLPDIAEQKTIADCLSAHDTLIDAQVAKLDTLQTHKQGLQQQLFPPLESQ